MLKWIQTDKKLKKSKKILIINHYRICINETGHANRRLYSSFYLIIILVTHLYKLFLRKKNQEVCQTIIADFYG